MSSAFSAWFKERNPGYKNYMGKRSREERGEAKGEKTTLEGEATRFFPGEIHMEESSAFFYGEIDFCTIFFYELMCSWESENLCSF